MADAAAVFSFPTTIVFGAGTAAQLYERFSSRTGASKPLLVTDRGLMETRAFATVRDALGGRERVFGDVQPNPTDANVRAAADAFKMAGCDCVIAVGGGSAIDVGKIIRLITLFSDRRLSAFTGN